MNQNDLLLLTEIIGIEAVMTLCEHFPNKKLPGKKFLRRIQKEKFLRTFSGENISNAAKKCGVSKQTAYNWIRTYYHSINK